MHVRSICQIGFLLLLLLPSPIVAGSLSPSSPIDHPPELLSMMVYIPAGEFLIGSNEGAEDQKPLKKLFIDAFYIDLYEVTNERYRTFVEETVRWLPHLDDPRADLYNWKDGTYPGGKGDHPVVLVSWEDARAYCEWVGKRLPTEMEFEKAARGVDGKKYSFGNAWDANKANTWERGIRATMPVGSNRDDRSAYGVYDLTGNVAEWVEDWYQAYPWNQRMNYDFGEKFKVLRGGSWDYYESSARAYNRATANPMYRGPAVGFRCALSSKGQKGPAEARLTETVGASHTAPLSTAQAETQGGVKLSREEIKELQHALLNAGYDPGGVDGTMGKKTKQAIIAFQAAHSLSPTGLVNQEMLKKLKSR